jgi:hypothetical protein
VVLQLWRGFIIKGRLEQPPLRADSAQFPRDGTARSGRPSTPRVVRGACAYTQLVGTLSNAAPASTSSRGRATPTISRQQMLKTCDSGQTEDDPAELLHFVRTHAVFTSSTPASCSSVSTCCRLHPVRTRATDLILGRVAPEKVSMPFMRACRACDIRDLRFHDLRHTSTAQRCECLLLEFATSLRLLSRMHTRGAQAWAGLSVPT